MPSRLLDLIDGLDSRLDRAPSVYAATLALRINGAFGVARGKLTDGVGRIIVHAGLLLGSDGRNIRKIIPREVFTEAHCYTRAR